MRIAIDLDGTICPIRQPQQNYFELEPLPGAVEHIRELKASGHYIIIFTSRNMATSEGNLGRVMKNVAKITLDWLEKYSIEYDEIYFGKPNAEVYIDDRAIRFSDWDDLTEDDLNQQARAR